MFESITYETPEVLELGEAKALTLGYPNRETDDGCDCTKDVEIDV